MRIYDDNYAYCAGDFEFAIYNLKSKKKVSKINTKDFISSMEIIREKNKETIFLSSKLLYYTQHKHLIKKYFHYKPQPECINDFLGSRLMRLQISLYRLIYTSSFLGCGMGFVN